MRLTPAKGSSASGAGRLGRSTAIGNVQLGGIPRLVLGVWEDRPQIRGVIEQGIDILEVRVDQLKRTEPNHVVDGIKKLKGYGRPIIGTVRCHKEGGGANLSNATRGTLYESILPLVDAIDMELSSASDLKTVIASTRKQHKALIISYHNFTETPTKDALEDILARATEVGADIVKIAVFAAQDEDVVRLLNFTIANRDKSLVTIALGAKGSISRLAFPLAGSLMTYTSIDPAHGQVPPEEFIHHLRLYYPEFNEHVVVDHQLLQYA